MLECGLGSLCMQSVVIELVSYDQWVLYSVYECVCERVYAHVHVITSLWNLLFHFSSAFHFILDLYMVVREVTSASM